MQALKSLFYNFFDTQVVKEGDSAQTKVLVSMQVPELSINPFYNFDEDDLRLEQSVSMSINFGYSTNRSG